MYVRQIYGRRGKCNNTIFITITFYYHYTIVYRNYIDTANYFNFKLEKEKKKKKMMLVFSVFLQLR